MHQNNPMFVLGNDDASILNLGKLWQISLRNCRSLPNNTPITLSCSIGENSIVLCIQVLADKKKCRIL